MEPNQFITQESILTVGGSSFVVLIITNSLCYAFNLSNKYIALIISLLISFIIFFSTEVFSLLGLLFALINGLLIYSTALGLNQAGHSYRKKEPIPEPAYEAPAPQSPRKESAWPPAVQRPRSETVSAPPLQRSKKGKRFFNSWLRES